MKNQPIIVNGKKVCQSNISRYTHMHIAIYKANELNFNEHNIGKRGFSVLHGDKNQYWVVTNRDAKILNDDGNGYEIVHRAGGFEGLRILKSGKSR